MINYKLFTFIDKVKILSNGKKYYKYIRNKYVPVSYSEVKDYFTDDNIAFDVEIIDSYFKLYKNLEYIKFSSYNNSEFSDIPIIGYCCKKNNLYLTERNNFTIFSSIKNNIIVFSNIYLCVSKMKYVNLKYPGIYIEKIKYTTDFEILSAYTLLSDNKTLHKSL